MYSPRLLANKFPDMDKKKVARAFRKLSFQDKRTVVEAARLSLFDDCLGREIAKACPNEA